MITLDTGKRFVIRLAFRGWSWKPRRVNLRETRASPGTVLCWKSAFTWLGVTVLRRRPKQEKARMLEGIRDKRFRKYLTRRYV